MSDLASVLVAASAAVVFGLGCVHLLITFRGNQLNPRDDPLLARMKAVSPVITRQTTMWKAWIGFNASHSHGAILFGLVYGYLSLVEPAVLFGSWFLLVVGLAMLAGYVFLGWFYWFSVPFRGIVLSACLYGAALLAHFL